MIISSQPKRNQGRVREIIQSLRVMLPCYGTVRGGVYAPTVYVVYTSKYGRWLLVRKKTTKKIVYPQEGQSVLTLLDTAGCAGWRRA